MQWVFVSGPPIVPALIIRCMWAATTVVIARAGAVPGFSRLAEVAVDEQPVAVSEPDVVGGLRRGRILPDDARAALCGHSREKSSERP